MSEFWAVARAIARFNLKAVFTNPALIVPSILFPLVFLLAFAGGLSSVGNTPGFGFRSGYTSFQFVFVLLQAAAFSGVFTGFGVAAAFESGFGRRLMLAAPSRAGIVAGYLLASLGRFAFTAFMLTVVGLLAGMEVDGTSGQYAALILLAFGLNTASTLFGVGFALRTRTIQAAPAMQIPVFTILFLAPVFVPLELLDGWIASVASVNPLTALVQSGRGFISGVPDGSGLAFAVAAGLIAVMLVWAARSLRKAEAGGV